LRVFLIDCVLYFLTNFVAIIPVGSAGVEFGGSYGSDFFLKGGRGQFAGFILGDWWNFGFLLGNFLCGNCPFEGSGVGLEGVEGGE
jgi:hypothetical protein